MAQISRPFQIAFVAVALLAGVWLFALHGRSSTSSEPGASAPAASASAPATSASTSSSSSSATAQAEEKAAGTSTPVYKGAAPGVSGLSRAIAKAHEAVANSQTGAKQVEGESATATPPAGATTSYPQGKSSGTSAASAGSAASAAAPAHATHTVAAPVHRAAATKTHHAAAPTRSSTTAPTKTSPSTAKTTVTPAAASGSASTGVANQKAVEAQLKAGKVVLILFWDPSGADDVAVHRQVQSVARSERSRVAFHEAGAGAVASFGTITRGVPVYGTPTLLVVGKGGQTTVLTGLTDAFAIEQVIAETSHS